MSFPQGPILPFPWGADGRREEGQASGMILRARTCARRLLCVGSLVSPKASLGGTDAGWCSGGQGQLPQGEDQHVGPSTPGPLSGHRGGRSLVGDSQWPVTRPLEGWLWTHIYASRSE